MVFQDFYRLAFIENALFKVLVSFTGHHCLHRSLTSSYRTKETAMTSFQLEGCVQVAIAPTILLIHH